MEMDFVSFDLAKKLKEKGFNQQCIAHYYYTLRLFEYNMKDISFRRKLLVTDFMHSYNESKKGNRYIDAPTISQVLKWLREDKKIHIEFVAAAYGYNYIVSDTPEKGGTDRHCSAIKYEGPNDGGAWDEYEAAAIAGIEYCLDNLI